MVSGQRQHLHDLDMAMWDSGSRNLLAIENRFVKIEQITKSLVKKNQKHFYLVNLIKLFLFTLQGVISTNPTAMGEGYVVSQSTYSKLHCFGSLYQTTALFLRLDPRFSKPVHAISNISNNSIKKTNFVIRRFL